MMEDPYLGAKLLSMEDPLHETQGSLHKYCCVAVDNNLPTEPKAFEAANSPMEEEAGHSGLL